MRHLAALTAVDALRLICGFFFLPHAVGKFTAKEASFGFFRAAGFRPAPLFAYAAMLIEVMLAGLLLSGTLVRPTAWTAAIYLLVATLAVIKVEKKWLWHIGGCEFPFFWALCCAIVATFD
ncbi:MAG: DoxX family protein [Pseudomonadota bacterium]|nr:DoxX family protein [Pseudomonadota bacterium]